MSIRQSLMAILAQGPCYGYQLRSEFDRRTASASPVNIGQVYSTLDRLERDGLAVTDHTDEHGHVYYRITPSGRTAVDQWWATPVAAGAERRDELAIKLSLAATLPGVDLAAVIAVQRVAVDAEIAEFEVLAASGAESEVPARIVLGAQLAQSHARRELLDAVSGKWASSAKSPLANAMPRKGRPPAHRGDGAGTGTSNGIGTGTGIGAVGTPAATA